MTQEDDIRRKEALAQIASSSPFERYHGAKSLIKLGRPDDLKTLMVARKSESDAYARKWLDLAIAACARKSSIESADKLDEDGQSIDSEARERIRSQAIEWVAGVLLHEIGSKIGLLASAARQEISDYRNSETARHVANLDRIFEGVVELRKAAASPKIQEFDLPQLVEEIVVIETQGSGVDVSVVGRSPLILFSDPDLLRLVLCNGIRNAVEAVKSMPVIPDHPIVITWEVTDKEYWVSVIDNGPGIAGAVDAAFEIGRTNKAGHAGFGLAIAKQAMEKLGGTITLSASTGGGAAYQIRGALIQ